MDNVENLPISVIQLKKIRAMLAHLKEQESELVKLVIADYQDAINDALSQKDYGAGTVNLDGLKFEVKKNVTWDQDGLALLWNKLKQEGKQASEYMDFKLSVAENAYKNWPSEIKEKFTPYRTVKTSAISVSFNDKE